MNDSTTTIAEIKKDIKDFVAVRDWEKFHTPKDVAVALSIEIGEVLEHFRWKSNEEIALWLKDPKNKEELADEIGDCVSFLVDLGRVTNIDLSHAFEQKLAKAGKKYPVDKVKGKHHKYTYYEENK